MELQELARRISEVANEFRHGPELTPDMVDFRHVASMAWALDCVPHLVLARLQPGVVRRGSAAEEVEELRE